MCAGNAGCGCGNCTGINIGKTGATGAAGTTGADGANGQYGGYSSRWLFSSGTSSNPAGGSFRLNNSSPASATIAYISEVNADVANLSLFLASFDNGGDFGRLRIFKEFDSSIYADYLVTGATDSGSYWTMNLTYVSSSVTTLTNLDSTVISFAANGADGANGLNGVAVITSQAFNESVAMNNYESPYAAYHLVASPFTLIDIVVPLDSCLQTNEDEVEFRYTLKLSEAIDTKGLNSIFGVAINDTNSLSGATNSGAYALHTIPVLTEGLSIMVSAIGKLTRLSSTTFRVAVSYSISNYADYGLAGIPPFSIEPSESRSTADLTDVGYATTFTYNNPANTELHIIPIVGKSSTAFFVPFYAWSIINLQAWHGKKLV